MALSAVLKGGSMRCPVADDLWKRVKEGSVGAVLSLRQRTVLKMVAEGMSNKVIASHLSVSEKAIEHDRARLMDQLGTRDVANLTRVAMRMGLVN
jgi:DNA-binding NarL/FixJ family response regulator